jgi:hypothetical protein
LASGCDNSFVDLIQAHSPRRLLPTIRIVRMGRTLPLADQHLEMSMFC